MAVLTAATGYPRNYGPFGAGRLIAVKFTGVNVNDTYASNLKNVVDFWATVTSAQTTQASAGVNVTLSGTTFTVKPGEDNATVVLYIITRA